MREEKESVIKFGNQLNNEIMMTAASELDIRYGEERDVVKTFTQLQESFKES